MIPFNIPYFSGREEENLKKLLHTGQITSSGEFSQFCKSFLEKEFQGSTVFLTQSATQAIEISTILADIGPGDEVIMPSFTYVSSANPFVLRGAKIIFVDISPETMNLNPDLLEAALTKKTKAILPVHYGGISAEMSKITEFAEKHNLFVIEDAAHALGSILNRKPLGTFGDTACISFHATKNIQCGEGGALIINNQSLIKKAEEIVNNGTNRSAFLRGEVPAYTWT
ncbi:MAG: aminotransferase class I/II-fold pyridoxal phosphate-dependent enzyme, partial [Bacteroidales bacterium]|nr:aminotransferase class I/II-fold pyridoxal phosphate-dependent enzyme [Bacteroidales bacterium]